MQAVNVYGVREKDKNYILNIEFLNKFDINLFCTSHDNVFGDNIIYGIKISYDEIKKGIKKSNRIILSKFTKYISNTFNKRFDQPIAIPAFYKANIDKNEFKFDYSYDKYKGEIINEYLIQGSFHLKYCRFDENSMNFILENFKVNTLLYNYEIIRIQLENISDINSYKLDILIKTIGNKVEEWLEKIKQESIKYSDLNNLKII